ncbi:hypothetical protein L345_17783, partial [Ophiophagus hannah]
MNQQLVLLLPLSPLCRRPLATGPPPAELSWGGSCCQGQSGKTGSASPPPGGESQGEAASAAAAASQDARLRVAGLQLYQAAYQKSLPHMAEALAQGAGVNWSNQENGFTPLIQAVRGGSLVTCEFLLQNGANVNLRDAQGRGPLHHATLLGHTGQVCLFLKRGANQHARDEDGKDPLSVAIEAANADIVTLLRLARMNEEMRESEGLYGQPGPPAHSPTERQYGKGPQEFLGGGGCLRF